MLAVAVWAEYDEIGIVFGGDVAEDITRTTNAHDGAHCLITLDTRTQLVVRLGTGVCFQDSWREAFGDEKGRPCGRFDRVYENDARIRCER